MIFQSFLLGNLTSLYMKIINSVVVVGLYYGFLTTFSIGPSYLLLLQAQIQVIEEGEEAIEKEVSAATGFIMGQLLMFISIYYTPLHIALGRPHTITFLVLPYLFLHYCWYNSEDFFDYDEYTSKNSMRNLSIQCIFLNNLIFQLLNHFFFPSSMLARLVNIYMFRCNNKMLLVTSSFVGWLIGHILFMKWVRLVLVWIQQNYLVRSNKYIRSKKYLYYVFRFYQNFIFDLRNSMDQIGSILVFFTCLCTLGRMPSPILTHKLEETQQEIGEETDVELEKTSEQEEGGFTEEDPSPSLFKLFKEACYKNSPTSYSGNQDISKLEILKEEKKNLLWFEKPLLLSLLFDYNRWNRPMRYIKNNRFENAVRNEMSQYFFYTCQNDGKQRISFSYPPSLAIFWEMIQRKISLSTTEKFFYDELYNYWIYTNEQKKNSLINEFSNRISVLDKKGLKKINVFEKKTRLCNDKKKKEYLPKIYDPFLNGSYRGLIKKLFSPSIRIINETAMAIKNWRPSMIIINEREIPIKNKNWRPFIFIKKKNQIEDAIWINKIQSLLGNDYNYHEFEQKIDTVDKESLSAEFEHFMSFIKDSLTQTIPKKAKKSIGIKEISKKVPRWPYKIINEIEQLHKEEHEGVLLEPEIREIPVRRIILYDNKEKDEVVSRLILKRYVPGSQFDRELIKGSMRAQKRKTSIWAMSQAHAHSGFFLNRTDSLVYALLKLCQFIKGFFLRYMGKISEFERLAYYPSFDDFLISLEESGEQLDRMDEIDEQIKEAEAVWEDLAYGQAIRSLVLFAQSILRKYILLPLLIIAKNIGRILLLQRPEWSEDFKEWDKEVHLKCTYNGVPFSETEFPATWSEEGMQIMVVSPFRLKPWHGSWPSDQDENDSFYFTALGLATETPYGPPQAPDLFSFFKPIFKKLYKKINKFRKNCTKKNWIIFIQNLLFNLFNNRLLKKLSNVNPIFEFELRDNSSEIKKENNSIINNQMIHESSIEAQFMNLTNYSVTQKRMKNLAIRRSTIRNQIDEISKIVNISPNKTHYGVKRLESLQNIVQILKRRIARLIRKSGYLIEFFMEKIYVDLFLYIFNISRIYTQLFFLGSIKKILDKSIYNNETNQERVDRTNKNPIQFILNIKKSHFLFSSLLNSKINENSRSHSDLSFLSQAYVFYKLSQAQLINLYKLKSVFQYYGTSLFLKNEIKDYFGTQGIIHSELRTKKLPNSGMNQWKNWLKSNYQYDLSQRKWSLLVPQKWRNRINEYCRGENKNLKKKKWNSYEKEQLINSNYQNANNSEAHLLLLPDEKENLKKNHKYEVLSYKFLFHEDKKDSYSYRIPFQGNKNQEFSSTYNYNIHKGNLIDMWRSIPITNYLGINNIRDIEKNTDRKYFDWKIIHFGLRKKGRIGAWIDISTSSNKNTKTEPKNYQIVDEFDIGDEMDEKEKEIDKKENEIYKEKNEIDKEEIFCRTIYQEINRSHQKKNLFDWMGMNEEILSRPISNLESWFFPEFVLLYNAYKIKPWTIPINLLFSNFENFSVNRKKNKNAFDFDSITQDEKELVGQRNLRSYVRKNFENKESLSIDEDFLCILPKYFILQLDWHELLDDEDVFDNLDLIILMLNLRQKRRRDFAISFIKKGDLNIDILLPRGITPVSKLLKKGIFIIEPNRLSMSIKSDGQFILYQTIGISLVHKSKRQNNQKRYRDKNNYDLLIPENILSPRRRRELRILICFNSRNNKGVDKNPVFCNGNRVKNGSQFFDKRKDKDRDKNELIEFQFFRLPNCNYQLKDYLDCMNRYCIHTNKDSQFFDKSKDKDLDQKELRIELQCFRSPNCNYQLENYLDCMNRYCIQTNKGSQFFDKSKDKDLDQKELFKFKCFCSPNCNYQLENYLDCMSRYWIYTNKGKDNELIKFKFFGLPNCNYQLEDYLDCMNRYRIYTNKGSQFFDKRKDKDRDKNELIKFQFFLWPNYRLEDLACMNRYWFNTNNGSRFSILRIHMYPRLKK